MSNEKKKMTQEEAEQDFQNAMSNIFSEKIPGVRRDEDGFIVIPMKRRKKRTDKNE